MSTPTGIRGDYNVVPYQSTHNTGGTITGADPKTSVVNRYLQSWDADNLFVMGASVFPQNQSYNPTGLVGALAYWSASSRRPAAGTARRDHGGWSPPATRSPTVTMRPPRPPAAR